jgi:hypothetical protein
MSTHTHTTTATRVHTATWLAEVVMGTISEILADIGVDVTEFYRDWDQDESAIKNWIAEQSLKMVILECHQPNKRVSPVVEFPVRYATSGVSDAQFTASRAALARFRTKIQRVPAGTTYRLFCTFNGNHSSQPGWSPGTRASTEGLIPLSVRSIATAPHATADLRYLR